MPLSKIAMTIFVPALAFGVLGYFMGAILGAIRGSDKVMPIFGTTSNDTFLFACIPVVLFYLSTYLRASSEDRKPIGALLYIFSVVIIFWAIFHQNGNVLTTWAEANTYREMPSAVQSIAEKVDMEQLVTNKRDAKGDVNIYLRQST